MSSLLTAQTILTISQQYTLYVSFIILFSGFFGHTANIFVLTRLRIFRNNPSAFYLIAESVVNLLQMLIPFTSRIAMTGFGNDLTQTSLLWCKLRQVISQPITLLSLSIVCFASIDQYLATSHRPNLRQISTTDLGQILLTIAVITWLLHTIPLAVFYEIQPITGCSVTNQIFLFIIHTYIILFTLLLYRSLYPAYSVY